MDTPTSAERGLSNNDAPPQEAADPADLLVDVAGLDGTVTQYRTQAKQTVLDLKRAIGENLQLATAHFRLLAGGAVLRNEQDLASVCALAPAGNGGAALLHLVRDLERQGRALEQVEHIWASAPAGAWGNAAEGLIRALAEAGVEQGQVICIDLHCKDTGLAAAFACAFFSRELPGRGLLDIGFAVQQGNSWEDLYRDACNFAVNVEVISITGSSDQHGKLMAVFYYRGESPSAPLLEPVSAEGAERRAIARSRPAQTLRRRGPTWDSAACRILMNLGELGIQSGQVLAIDAHNDEPDGDARFCAFVCRHLPGRGRMAVKFESFNEQAEWDDFYQQCGQVAAGCRVIGITCCSNSDGRSVAYTFMAMDGECVQHVETEADPGAWDVAAQRLLAELQAAGVQRGQLVQIDAHNDGPGTPAVLSAHFDPSRPGLGPLQAAFECHQAAGWPDLCRWAVQAAAGRTVLAVTGASTSEASMCMLLFYEQGQQDGSPAGAVEFVEVGPYGSWHGAAEELRQRLQGLGIQRGQLLSIDAHNEAPEQGAMFSAHYCRALPGRGPLALRFACLNVHASWSAVHRQAAAMAAADKVVAVTGSSNEHGRRVMYIFSADD